MCGAMSDEPRGLPDCPKCDAVQTLTVFRSDTRGLKWAHCSCCSAVVLLDPEDRILHVTPRP